ncbi:protein kinase domain-containing protein [Cryptosporidium muris RN66]|uniref:Protein kinase domain-containing protein n=1 Tax=Cryptosporidium muris (strain RN66) TaxID=441375 RepID=B6AG39_CRYMR|nr:protein kinase domain-containing protein [Cryptosporidium muris RN66]EEA07180.1 protein kinase domain-containing protein [Cryptosporidium muris RN66]|eukprot:XP_002141529.1 protein kinase domain-containing protein [Cryptosporidium muris RN66]
MNFQVSPILQNSISWSANSTNGSFIANREYLVRNKENSTIQFSENPKGSYSNGNTLNVDRQVSARCTSIPRYNSNFCKYSTPNILNSNSKRFIIGIPKTNILSHVNPVLSRSVSFSSANSQLVQNSRNYLEKPIPSSISSVGSQPSIKGVNTQNSSSTNINNTFGSANKTSLSNTSLKIPPRQISYTARQPSVSAKINPISSKHNNANLKIPFIRLPSISSRSYIHSISSQHLPIPYVNKSAGISSANFAYTSSFKSSETPNQSLDVINGKSLISNNKLIYRGFEDVNKRNYILEITDVEINIQDIKLKKLLGRGATSLVYLAIWRGTDVAVKLLGNLADFQNVEKESEIPCLISNEKNSLRLKEFEGEVNIMKHVRHPNIILYMGGNIRSNPPFVVTEYCAGGSLFNLLYGMSRHNQESDQVTFTGPSFKLTIYQRLKILLDIARGIYFLHSSDPPIVHRDIKSLNILLAYPVDNQNDVPLAKVGDLGLCKHASNGNEGSYCGNKIENVVGTYQWMAPEVITNQIYNTYIDVYSFGMIIYELVTNKTPFLEFGVNVDPDILVSEIIKGTRPCMDYIIENIPQEIIKLMQSCWDQVPLNRPNMMDVISDLILLINKSHSTQNI